MHFLQRNFHRSLFVDLSGFSLFIYCQGMSWLCRYTSRQTFLKQMFQQYWVKNKFTLTRFTTQAIMSWYRTYEPLLSVYVLAIASLFAKLHGPKVQQRYFLERNSENIIKYKQEILKCKLHRFGKALINSTGKQLFPICMFLKSMCFSDTKHYTTKLPTLMSVATILTWFTKDCIFIYCAVSKLRNELELGLPVLHNHMLQQCLQWIF